MNKTYGSRYSETKGLRTPELAKLVRADLKLATAPGGLLAGFKFSVTCDRFAGGSSMTVALVGAPSWFTVNDKGRLWRDFVTPHAPPSGAWQSPEARVLEAALSRIMGAYNFDNSDLMTDYFDVRFYAHANVHEVTPERKTAEAEIAAIQALSGVFASKAAA